MAIKQINLRIKDGNRYESPARDVTPQAALVSFVVYELGYGGHVTEITQTRIVVVTEIMGCMDYTTFTGSEEEMALLFKAGVLSLQIDPLEIPGLKEHVINDLMKKTKGIPLLINMGHGMIVGSTSIRCILAAMSGIEDEERLKRFLSLTRADMLAVLCLQHEEQMSIDNALELAGA